MLCILCSLWWWKAFWIYMCCWQESPPVLFANCVSPVVWECVEGERGSKTNVLCISCRVQLWTFEALCQHKFSISGVFAVVNNSGPSYSNFNLIYWKWHNNFLKIRLRSEAQFPLNWLYWWKWGDDLQHLKLFSDSQAKALMHIKYSIML